MFMWTLGSSCLLLVPMRTGRPDVLRAVQLPEHNICFSLLCVYFLVGAAAGCCLLSMAGSPPALCSPCKVVEERIKPIQAEGLPHFLRFSVLSLLISDVSPCPTSPSLMLPHYLSKEIKTCLWVSGMGSAVDIDTAAGRCTDNSIVHSLD